MRDLVVKYLTENHSHVDGDEKRFSNHSNKVSKSNIPTSDINIKQSTANLLSITDVLEKVGIKYSVVFGTLLGIYRDGNLIKHDKDSDLAVWLEDPDKFIEAIKELEGIELKVTRFNVCLVSFTRGGDYTDLYLFTDRKPTDGKLHCIPTYGTLTPMDFDGSNTINFGGKDLVCVNNPEEYFQKIYGSDWSTPIKGLHADIKNEER
jgi:hypothetical protein